MQQGVRRMVALTCSRKKMDHFHQGAVDLHQIYASNATTETVGSATTMLKRGRDCTIRLETIGTSGSESHNSVGYSRKTGLRTRQHMSILLSLVAAVFLSVLTTSSVTAANYNNNYYNNGGYNNNNNNYNNYNNGNNNNQNYRDDDYYLRNQQYYVNDDYYNGGGGGNGNDDAQSAAANDDQSGSAAGDDGYSKEQKQYSTHDDDEFHWDANIGFDGVSVMPVSCINYNNGHMIKFQLFDSSQGTQCRFSEIATFVVSIAHYMRAYFNYQALSEGQDFSLPNDAAFLNCIQITGTSFNGLPLYAKIGCMQRETFTSTKLQLHVYTDAQCSQSYDDGLTARQHATKGYKITEGMLDSKVSFRPPFYSCLTCSPEEVSGTFNKKSSTWYDDDYISEHGNKQGNDDADEEEEKEEEANDDAANNDDDGNGNKKGDDYYRDDYFDDKYMAANDDVNNLDDDGGRRRSRQLIKASSKDLKSYAEEFWKEYHELQAHRSLYDNYYDVGDWNMCQRIYKYGLWCDEECRALDFFRSNEWSGADVFLLVIMCVFLTAMLLLVVAKRLKAQQKARMYGEDLPMPGLPPFAMAIIFVVILATIITLAKLKFINETLVFAVVTCILLFIYMLKLTLFENRRPVLLAAPRHDMFDNPLDEHLFD